MFKDLIDRIFAPRNDGLNDGRNDGLSMSLQQLQATAEVVRELKMQRERQEAERNATEESAELCSTVERAIRDLPKGLVEAACRGDEQYPVVPICRGYIQSWEPLEGVTCDMTRRYRRYEINSGVLKRAWDYCVELNLDPKIKLDIVRGRAQHYIVIPLKSEPPAVTVTALPAA